MQKYILPQNKHLDDIMERVVYEAKKSTCERSKCGSIILSNKSFENKSFSTIGHGHNSQPTCVTSLVNKKLLCFKDSLPKGFKSDKTCCVHAEQRAIMFALSAENVRVLKNSWLFFIRLDENDKTLHAGDPYCTICSKMALDVGIGKFCLWHKEGWTAYNTDYYNELSFQFNSETIK
ncbi:MAG: hypothetical protein AABY22_26885 [Nanoarchaeota archaeon]